jgi:hypothetical protein
MTGSVGVDVRHMSESPQGYQAFWKRVARHVSLSDAAKAIGVRASILSGFEKGNIEALTADQVNALNAYLDAIPLPEPEIPEIVDDEEPGEA